MIGVAGALVRMTSTARPSVALRWGSVRRSDRTSRRSSPCPGKIPPSRCGNRLRRLRPSGIAGMAANRSNTRRGPATHPDNAGVVTRKHGVRRSATHDGDRWGADGGHGGGGGRPHRRSSALRGSRPEATNAAQARNRARAASGRSTGSRFDVPSCWRPAIPTRTPSRNGERCAGALATTPPNRRSGAGVPDVRRSSELQPVRIE